MSVHIANQIIKKEWTDYNNHMNMAYYVLVFDQVWEVMLEKFKMGENSAKTTNMSTMVVETYTTYNNEVKEGDEVEINLTFFDHDKKRLHYKMEMIEKSSQKLSATLEMLSLYIDLDKRKVSEFENDKLKVMDNFINLNKSNFNNDNFLDFGQDKIQTIKLNSIKDNKKFDVNAVEILYSLPVNSFTLINDEENNIYLAKVKKYQNKYHYRNSNTWTFCCNRT